jgi:geranylgeranyl diphosphate synthase type II
MNIIAYQHLCRTRTEFIPELTETFFKVALEICEGQQWDMNFESLTNVALDDYLEMIRLKTAVLLATSLKIGAICGNAPEREKELLYQFGLNLGLAFQVQDDLLDTFGTQQEFGKSIGGDIRAGKKTFIYLKALELASHGQREELSAVYSDKQMDQDEKVHRIIRIFSDLHVRKIAEETVASYTAKAMKSLEAVLAPGSKKELEKLAYQIMKRKA